ncbi:ABC-type lipoprotein release transport system permease subunit [Planifilum fimeticola]|uniref:ABC-type lipoprotein release transport system permease subunit n=1 Tax=Planifilum fimeticola TaxID=201975 RepID=A0A2T0LGW6_9BACL|nr:ABC transporter permease [Planifilum fimeticola]PRX41576.1 ABC-type lipoprotein release transport system permease subunit [Planifilum fimeticola]
MAVIFAGLLAAAILATAFFPGRDPHLRRMAVRNLAVRKSTTVFTVVGAMTGTALITASLLITGSIQASVDRFFEEQFGRIVGDISAGEQKGLKRPYMTAEDVRDIERLAEKEGYDCVLPTVGLTVTLVKSDEKGRPLLLSPRTYVHGWDPAAAGKFDPEAVKEIPSDLGEGEIVLSDRAANRLEAQEGDRLFVLDAGGRMQPFTVKKVVTERGLTGYRGLEKAQATALVSLDAARTLSDIGDGYNHVLLGRSPNRLDASSGLLFRSAGVFKSEKEGWVVSHVREVAVHDLDQLFKFIPVFFIAGLNAVLIGLALIVNIFRMIAEERRREWGILRAIGMNRRDLSRLLRTEGLLYAGLSALLGVIAGIGLSYLLLMLLKDTFRRMAEYGNQLTVRFLFHVDPAFLLAGFTIGLLTVLLCAALAARRAGRVSIVEALQRSGSQERRGLTRERSVLRGAGALMVFALTFSLFTVTMTRGFREWVGETGQPLIVFAVGFLLVVLLMISVIAIMPRLFAGIARLFRPFPRRFGELILAFRYPEVNRLRTGLLFLMFTLVLYLTSFSSVFVSSFAAFFGDFDARRATGGYDFTATAGGEFSTQDLENLFRSSEYVDPADIDAAVAVPYVQSVESVNGVDIRYAETNGIRLVKRDERYSSDRAVWAEVARNPDVAVVEEKLLKWSWDEEHKGMVSRSKPLTVGDDYPIVADGRVVARKKIIGIAQSEKESYGYPASGGVWVKAGEIRKLAGSRKNIQTALLIRARSADSLSQLSRNLEKTFNLNNIFGLKNPREEFLLSNLSFRTLFSLFEGFSALATFIGIAGLMVVMFRTVQERRQQIGMLRAIGLSAPSIFRILLMEGAFIAWTGIAAGMGIGCYSGYLMIRALSPEGSVAILFPWLKLAVYFGGALLITLLFAMIPARKAVRLSPAEATRYVG